MTQTGLITHVARVCPVQGSEEVDDVAADDEHSAVPREPHLLVHQWLVRVDGGLAGQDHHQGGQQQHPELLVACWNTGVASSNCIVRNPDRVLLASHILITLSLKQKQGVDSYHILFL